MGSGGWGGTRTPVTATVSVDTNPAGIAVDSTTNSVYVVNSPPSCLNGSPGGVTRIDGTDNTNVGQSLPFERRDECRPSSLAHCRIEQLVDAKVFAGPATSRTWWLAGPTLVPLPTTVRCVYAELELVVRCHPDLQRDAAVPEKLSLHRHSYALGYALDRARNRQRCNSSRNVDGKRR